ncbi:GIY-YIG nuclease family protein [Pedobacter sp. UYP30]|uniref:GIY-YIG nuclease family protein n=1 Tax=Pedobacter sp. UYP30 TaxID=1756400 RepID=UPI0033959ED8
MPKIHNCFVYFLECADKSYFRGVTNDLEIRFEEHCNGYAINSYSHKRRPLVLKY